MVNDQSITPNQYQAVSEGIKKLILTNNHATIGSIVFNKWSATKAAIISDNKTYQIAPKGIWNTTIQLKENDALLLYFKMNWKGGIIITTKFTLIEDQFTFKQAGFLKNDYLLLNEAGDELLTIKPHFKWTKFAYNYTITTTTLFDNNPHQNLLLLTALYCVIYSVAVINSAVV